jgi:hypothetical protein
MSNHLIDGHRTTLRIITRFWREAEERDFSKKSDRVMIEHLEISLAEDKGLKVLNISPDGRVKRGQIFRNLRPFLKGYRLPSRNKKRKEVKK